MGEFHLVNGILVLGALAVCAIPWGYPLARLCRRTGKPAWVGWLAGSIGLFFLGPVVCVWWLAVSKWDPPEMKS